MQLAPLDISPEEAKEKLAEYTGQLREERTAEDAAIAAGYRAASRGLPIISLPATIQAGGFFPSGLPKIAITRATNQDCYVNWEGYRTLIYNDGLTRNLGALVGRNTVRVELTEEHQHKWISGRTIVPVIPPRHRPRLRRLRGFHILWEVDSWDRVPPHDPALLRHIRGDLWAVMAVWDLTDLERHVLSQRALV